MVRWQINKNENDKYIKLKNMTDILSHKEYILRDFKEDARQRLDEWFEKIESEKIFECNGILSSLFQPIALALVRRTFPSLFANKIVGVQPMLAPVGLAYAMRFMYNNENEDGLSAKNNV
jgi:hypothetical protein